MWRDRSEARGDLKRCSARARRNSETALLRILARLPEAADEMIIVEQNREAADPWCFD
jgi:hypothetical protein